MAKNPTMAEMKEQLQLMDEEELAKFATTIAEQLRQTLEQKARDLEEEANNLIEWAKDAQRVPKTLDQLS